MRTNGSSNLPVSTTSEFAAQRYALGVTRLVSLAAKSDEALGSAITADPTFALPHAATAVLRWQQGRRLEARAAVERAQALASRCSLREQQLIAAIEAAVTGGGYVDDHGYQAANPVALRLGYAHLAQFPGDALMLFVVMLLSVFSGRPQEQEDLLALLRQVRSAYGDDPWFLSWYGFCHTEAGRLEEGRRATVQALALDPHSPVAAHGYAHVLQDLKEYEQGAAFLRGWLPGYDARAVYHSHISWHYGTLELALGHSTEALAVYRRAIDPGAVVPVRTTLADAVCFLWRCMLRGVPVPPPLWDRVRDYARQAVPQAGAPFRDVLAATAFAGAGDEAAFRQLMVSLSRLGEQGHPLADTLALPLAYGVHAFVQGDYQGTIRHIAPVLDDIPRMGGSSKQRELFEETLHEARCRARLAARSPALAAA